MSNVSTIDNDTCNNEIEINIDASADIKIISAKSNFSLSGRGNTAQLTFNGEVVKLSSLQTAGFSIEKSPVNHGQGEFCYRCAPKESGVLRIWYKASINCNNVRGFIWICSNCSTVYEHKRGGKALWAELIKALDSNADISPAVTGQLSSLSPYLPGREDFEAAYRHLAKPGNSVSIDTVLDTIEIHAVGKGFSLKNNWRIITERNIGEWSKNP